MAQNWKSWALNLLQKAAIRRGHGDVEIRIRQIKPDHKLAFVQNACNHLQHGHAETLTYDVLVQKFHIKYRPLLTVFLGTKETRA